jgi:hypothetical protein
MNEPRDKQPRVGLVISALLVVMLLASLDQTIVSIALNDHLKLHWRAI